MEWEMIPLNRVVTRVHQTVPTDERSLKILIQLPRTQIRITSHPMKIIRGKHIERAIALNDVIPMMIIGKNRDICVIGTTIVPPILRNQVV
jgi:hypothetical protein